MIFNRKFYDAVATEAVASASTETGTPSLASMMAKQGVKGTAEEVVIPTHTEVKEETKTETPIVAATATEVAKVEEVKTETPKSEEVKVETPKPQTEEAEIPQQSWQEVAQKQPNEVFKALGVNEQTAGIMDFLKENPKAVSLIEAYKDGKHVDYLRELSTDYTKLSSEDVMRHQLQRDYPTANQKTLDVLFKKEVVEKYNLNSEDESEKEEGELLLGAIADKHRADLIKNQENYLMPTPKEPVKVEPNLQATQQEQAEKQFKESYIQKVGNDPMTKNIIANKAFIIGEGDGKFIYPISPEEVLDVLFNNDNKMLDKIWEKAADTTGQLKYTSPKVEQQLLTAAVTVGGMDFINKLIEHGKSLGSKAVVDPLENAKPPEGGTSTQAKAAPKTLAGAMAQQGVYTAGGN